MTAWTHGEISLLRHMLDQRDSMEFICKYLIPHDRDEIVEAIDACRRTETSTAALRHVNHVLALQTAGEPLVNGNPQSTVCRNWSDRPIYKPDFL